MENNKPKRPWRALAIFFVVLMFVNLWLSKAMAKEPFIGFVVMAFLICGVLGAGFSTVYKTITRKDDK